MENSQCIAKVVRFSYRTKVDKSSKVRLITSWM